MKIAIDSVQPVRHTLALRLPDWCPEAKVTLNGLEVEQDIRKGYLHIRHPAGGRYDNPDAADAGSPRVWQSAGASRRR